VGNYNYRCFWTNIILGDICLSYFLRSIFWRTRLGSIFFFINFHNLRCRTIFVCRAGLYGLTNLCGFLTRHWVVFVRVIWKCRDKVVRLAFRDSAWVSPWDQSLGRQRLKGCIFCTRPRTICFFNDRYWLWDGTFEWSPIYLYSLCM
jgi:hypothetical protein